VSILDILFSTAEELWSSIQGTADNISQVVVDAAIVQVKGAFLNNPNAPRPAHVYDNVSLIYSPPNVVLQKPAIFAGSNYVTDATMIIEAPNFHSVPVQPNYLVNWAGLVYTPSTDDVTGAFFFPHPGTPNLFIFALGNLRLEPPT
jgi:hypothetical protein